MTEREILTLIGIGGETLALVGMEKVGSLMVGKDTRAVEMRRGDTAHGHGRGAILMHSMHMRLEVRAVVTTLVPEPRLPPRVSDQALQQRRVALTLKIAVVGTGCRLAFVCASQASGGRAGGSSS